MTESLNRRQSVRVTDRVLLAVKPVSEEKVESLARDFAQGISPYSQEDFSDIQIFIGAQSALQKLREKDADLADFLQYMDKKVNLLLKQAKGCASQLDDLAMRKVNLSAHGISFTQSEELPLGDTLEIHLVLLPEYVYVYTFGRVIACDREQASEDNPRAGGFRISLEFTFILDEDRGKIIQHTFKQQSQMLRNRRERSG